jgi:chromosome segregation ATPase
MPQPSDAQLRLQLEERLTLMQSSQAEAEALRRQRNELAGAVRALEAELSRAGEEIDRNDRTIAELEGHLTRASPELRRSADIAADAASARNWAAFAAAHAAAGRLDADALPS